MNRLLALLAVVAVAATVGMLSASPAHRTDPSQVACASVSFTAVDDHAVGFRPRGEVSLRSAYPSTRGALDLWWPTKTLHVMAHLWPAGPREGFAAACYFDGRFRTKDGRTFNSALVETDGRGRAILVVAGTALSPLRPVAPPRS